MQQSDDEKLFDRLVEVHAKDWGIPKKYWHRAAVRDHVRFCHQLRKLQQEINSRSRSLSENYSLINQSVM
jgi:hypothetical protein